MTFLLGLSCLFVGFSMGMSALMETKQKAPPPKAHVPLLGMNDTAPFLPDPGPAFIPSPPASASPVCLPFCTTWVISQANCSFPNLTHRLPERNLLQCRKIMNDHSRKI